MSLRLRKLYRIEFFLAMLASLFLLWGFYSLSKLPKNFPQEPTLSQNTFIDGQYVGGLTAAQASALLHGWDQKQAPFSFTLFFDQTKISSTAAELSMKKNNDEVINEALATQLKQKSQPLWENWQKLFATPVEQDFLTTTSFDPRAVTQMVAEFQKRTNKPGKEPSITLRISDAPRTLQINPGQLGQEVDVDKTITAFLTQAQKTASISAVVTTTSHQLSSIELQQARSRALQYVGKKILFTFAKVNITEELNDQQLIKLLQLPDGFLTPKIQLLTYSWKKDIDRLVQNPELTYDPKTLTVKSFTPPRDGLTLDQQQTQQLVLDGLSKIASGSASPTTVLFELPIATTSPATTLSDTNTLGIDERIGFGDSFFRHSIPGRIHNVTLTAERINNIIVKPGAEFSFVKTLGEVSAATGFAPAYIIQGDRTVLGDGGGVCQVSTTVFRALLNAGLPITRRVAHSYRVGYYEENSQPGFDATVFGGNTDLRFINDTSHDLLVHTEIDPQKLYLTVEIFGTSDGRTSTISDYQLSDVTPAPPPLYQSDPTLPHGTTKQIDFAAPGSKTTFTYTVKNQSGAVTHQETFASTYRPWRAIFLQGL